MRDVPDAELRVSGCGVAVARLVLGPTMRFQAPPNLVAPRTALVLSGRHRRLGRRLPAHPRPRQPGTPVAADLDELADLSGAAGSRSRAADGLSGLRPAGEPWLDPRIVPPRARAGRSRRPGSPSRADPRGRPWQEPDRSWGQPRSAVDLHHRDRRRRAVPRPAQRLRRGLRRLGRGAGAGGRPARPSRCVVADADVRCRARGTLEQTRRALTDARGRSCPARTPTAQRWRR